MNSILKFPFEKVSCEGKLTNEKLASAEILFFPGVRYSVLKSKEWDRDTTKKEEARKTYSR